MISAPMPTPIGHALAGVAVAWSSEPEGRWTSVVRALRTPLTIACIALAVLPDADLLYPPIHRSVTHSVGAAILVLIVASGVTAWVTGKIQWRVAMICAAAHATHLLLDWLGTDRFPPRGIEAFWPFSRTFYISGWDVFPPTERRIYLPQALGINLRAVTMEIAIVGPVAAIAGWITRIRRSRGRISVPDGQPRPSV